MIRNQILLSKRRFVHDNAPNSYLNSAADNGIIVNNQSNKVTKLPQVAPFIVFRKINTLKQQNEAAENKPNTANSALLKDKRQLNSTLLNSNNSNGRKTPLSLSSNSTKSFVNSITINNVTTKKTPPKVIRTKIPIKHSNHTEKPKSIPKSTHHNESKNILNDLKIEQEGDECLLCKYEKIITSNNLPNFARKRITQVLNNLTKPDKLNLDVNFFNDMIKLNAAAAAASAAAITTPMTRNKNNGALNSSNKTKKINNLNTNNEHALYSNSNSTLKTKVIKIPSIDPFYNNNSNTEDSLWDTDIENSAFKPNEKSTTNFNEQSLNNPSFLSSKIII